jgi:hypothetical protein
LPNTREAANLADRFVDHYDSYFRFITEPAIDPTKPVRPEPTQAPPEQLPNQPRRP